MSIQDFYARHEQDYSLGVHTDGFNPFYQQLEGGLTDPVRIGGRDFINLAANNYLGLAADSRVLSAMKHSIDLYGASLCGTPIATGCFTEFRRLEKRLAAFVGLEDAILLPSCYQANNGLFRAIAGEEDAILVDQYAHSSLIEGLRMPGAKVRPFLHNNRDSLERNLEMARAHRQVFVVSESVFSTEGSIAPFQDIVELCRKYSAVPVIDDSHGIGVLGSSGRGILEHSGISEYEGVYTASLGKALACSGGMIAGKKSLIDYLRYNCSQLIYSTALPPAIIGGLHAVLDIIETDFSALSARMWQHRSCLIEALQSADLPLAYGDAPITSIDAGGDAETLLLTRQLFDKGILATPFIYPSVPRGKGRVRLIAGANLSDASVQQAAAVLSSLQIPEL
ncbi:aminotransferase class I/II-fold pyridoxal phosphate-dependent enzyme [Spirochaeta dissipatitropha]